MAEMNRKYQKLPGRGLRRDSFIQITATFSRLWLGEDHLLLVDTTRFTESYKRFFYRDIEAIVVTQTSRRLILNCVLLAFALLFGGLSIATMGGWGIFFAITTGLFLIFILINSLLGPTCRCELTTAAQTDQLASIKRIGRAEKILARLRPLIAAAQESAPSAPGTFAPPS